MKNAIIAVALALLATGCATENHRIENRGGVTHDGLEEQPQKAVTGEGGLMRGANETRQMPTGQFTGRERTVGQVGQYPTTPREADPRELSDRTSPVVLPGETE
jgi:hypothetical protein